MNKNKCLRAEEEEDTDSDSKERKFFLFDSQNESYDACAARILLRTAAYLASKKSNC